MHENALNTAEAHIGAGPISLDRPSIDGAVLEVLKDLKTHRRGAILDAMGFASSMQLWLALRRLIANGTVRKVRHGVYALNSEHVVVEAVSTTRAQPPAWLENAVVGLLADLQEHRWGALMTLGEGVTVTELALTLRQLIAAGTIKRVRYGHYALSVARIEPPARAKHRPKSVKITSEQRALALLGTPRSSRELRAELGLTLARTNEILKSLRERGLVVRRRIPSQYHDFLHARADVDFDGALAKHVPRLGPTAVKLLSALRPDRLVLLDDAAACARTERHRILSRVRKLERYGLLSLIHLGNRNYLVLTSDGMAHVQRNPCQVPEAPAANLLEKFGAMRISFLQSLQVLGPLTTRELRATLAQIPEQKQSPGQMVRALRKENLVEAVSCSKGPGRYGLTEQGKAIAALIRLCHPEPSAEALSVRRAAFAAKFDRDHRALQA